MKKKAVVKQPLKRFRFATIGGATISIKATDPFDAVARLSKICNPTNLKVFS